MNLRSPWLQYLTKIVRPPLEALAEGQLRARMPVACRPGCLEDRRQFSHLEAVARSLVGLAPWLELSTPAPEETEIQRHLRATVITGLVEALNPKSPDYLHVREGTQPLVDWAFLAQALLRAPHQIFAALPGPTADHLIDVLTETRSITPYHNNWILFSATIEAALLRLTGQADRTRIDYAFRQFEQWYCGDGTYSDGPEFHADYYNSYVIHPMLVELCDVATCDDNRWDDLKSRILLRAQRQAVILERLIAPDGTFPPLGRSITYRCGAFHHLALMALREALPPTLKPASCRNALFATIDRSLRAEENFDAQGWLQIGLSGYQPDLGETYISTGSLYLCSTAFLPLGLSPSAIFWTDPDSTWTSQRAWSGENLPADSALKGV